MSRRVLPLRALLLFALAASAGCGSLSTLEPPVLFRCQTDAECVEPHICHLGLCVSPETVSQDGGAGPVVEAYGDACRRDSECGLVQGDCLASFPDGYCTTRGCDDCGETGVCLRTEIGDFCGQGCVSDSDCRRHYVCSGRYGVKSCLPAGGDGPQAPGASCESSSDCAGWPAFCETTWPGGYCVGLNCEACAAGSTCMTSGLYQGCYDRCARNSDCRAGYQCASISGNSICVPAG